MNVVEVTVILEKLVVIAHLLARAREGNTFRLTSPKPKP